MSRFESLDNRARHAAAGGDRAKQRGVVLIVALVTLIVMSLAGLLMFRATGTGVQVAGNVAFKQNATSLGDLGVETGRAFLLTNKFSALPLDTDIAAEGYFASWNPNFEVSAFGWDSAKEVSTNDGTGNRVRYVIHRLCSVPGPTTGAGQHCAIPSNGSPLGTGGGGAGGAGFTGLAGQPYYRITARVDGPRSTVSYVQVIMF